MPSIMLDTSLPVAMMKMHHSTDVSEVILCISNLKERKALHKALEIIEGMLDYKVRSSIWNCCIKERVSRRNILLKRPNNNYLCKYNICTYKKKPNGHYFI